MGHRKWTYLGWREIGGAQLVAEHDALYDAYKNSEKLRMETLDENNRLDRELDEARKRIAELESPLRVPFSDEAIDKMAREASYSIGGWGYDNWDKGIMRNAWRDSVRRALVAGGIEPCAPPEYDPADVALAPTGHVLRDRLVEAERKVESQRAELKRLNALVAELRDEVNEDNTNAAAVNDLLVQVQNLTAERDRFQGCYEQEIGEDEVAARKILRKRLNVPASEWPTKYIADALDERDDLRTKLSALHPGETVEGVIVERDHYRIQLDHAKQDIAILAALTPYLRDPVGWELDVMASDDGKPFYSQAELDWLRSRIRPTYECKECAKWKAHAAAIEDSSFDMIKRINMDRAALEGECKECAKNPAQAKLDLPTIDEFRVKVGENCGGGLNWMLICTIAGALHEWLRARAALEGE